MTPDRLRRSASGDPSSGSISIPGITSSSHRLVSFSRWQCLYRFKCSMSTTNALLIGQRVLLFSASLLEDQQMDHRGSPTSRDATRWAWRLAPRAQKGFSVKGIAFPMRFPSWSVPLSARW